jgi:hypothetical protein
MRTRLMVLTTALALGVLITAQLFATAQDQRILPLHDAYVSFDQQGVRSLAAIADSNDLMRVAGAVQGGSQQIILCRGNDIATAVKDSAIQFEFLGSRATMNASASDTVWLAVYLGSDGSAPAAYQVRSVQVIGRTIRVSYEPIPATQRTCDYFAYMVYVPVGMIEAGDYTLELLNMGAGDVTFTRTWQVTME